MFKILLSDKNLIHSVSVDLCDLSPSSVIVQACSISTQHKRGMSHPLHGEIYWSSQWSMLLHFLKWMDALEEKCFFVFPCDGNSSTQKYSHYLGWIPPLSQCELGSTAAPHDPDKWKMDDWMDGWRLSKRALGKMKGAPVSNYISMDWLEKHIGLMF